jgi:Putative Actinobacterial Holin-X, holin superfamily III
MEKLFTKAEDLADSIKEYINLRIASIKLSTAEKTATVVANIIAGSVAAMVMLLFVVFASVALAIGLGIWLGNSWVGFLIVAGLYLLFGIIVWAARGKLIKLPVMNALIQQLFTHNDNDDETD